MTASATNVSVADPSAAAPVGNPQTIDHSLTLGQRAAIWKRSVFNPETIFGPAIGAGIGSAIGRDVIGRTIMAGFAAMDGEDPRYFRLPGRSAWVRTRHAIVSTFVAPTASGRRIPAFSHFAGAYGAAFIANTWYPDRQANATDAARRGSISFGVGIGLNLLREFMPHFNKIAPR
jgi:hypothetical protein